MERLVTVAVSYTVFFFVYWMIYLAFLAANSLLPTNLATVYMAIACVLIPLGYVHYGNEDVEVEAEAMGGSSLKPPLIPQARICPCFNFRFCRK